jgi:hypothetical protein
MNIASASLMEGPSPWRTSVEDVFDLFQRKVERTQRHTT